MAGGCRIEISYIDPEVYTSIVNHELRRSILRSLYAMSLDRPVTKQELADRVGIGYHQLVYQLSHQLAAFWTVVDEKKVRGTRLEYLSPSSPNTIFITIGRDGKIFLVDPLANLFGPLAKVGTRCDSCSSKEMERCLAYVKGGCCFTAEPSAEEQAVLAASGRSGRPTPVDLAILCALKGVASGKSCAVSIPCESCPFMRRAIRIDGLGEGR
ncbi:MAG: hypothetical protein ISF22_00730 [Methanomassiliicoccus sp.]|nr:hypothetical protein [Methanomassiliicoccus sp.]